MTETLSLMIGLVGAVTGLAAVGWTIYWSLSEYWRRLRFNVGLAGDGKVTCLSVTITNVGRSTVLLDSVNGFGFVAERQGPLVEILQRRIESDKKLPRSTRRVLHSPIRRPSGLMMKQPPIRIECFDARDFYPEVYPPYSELEQMPGEYWGIDVTARDGRVWRISGDEIERGERAWIPRAVRPRLWRIIRLKRSRYRQVRKTLREARAYRRDTIGNEGLRKDFDRYLAKAPDVAPPEHDRLD